MRLEQLLERARTLAPLSFSEVVAVIEQNYRYTPSAFNNGLGDERVINTAGQNQGSCKLLGFAQLHGLDVTQTLHLFGDYYYQEVMNSPEGEDHANIRAFRRHGWAGVEFERQPLSPKSSG
jgi:hypothetical protein